MKTKRRRLITQWKSVQFQEKSLEKSIYWADQALQTSILNWKAVEQRYLQGRATAFEVTEIQNQVRLARFTVLQSQHQKYLNQIKALRLKGELVNTFGIEIQLPSL